MSNNALIQPCGRKLATFPKIGGRRSNQLNYRFTLTNFWLTELKYTNTNVVMSRFFLLIFIGILSLFQYVLSYKFA